MTQRSTKQKHRTMNYGGREVSASPLHWPAGHKRTSPYARGVARYRTADHDQLTLSQARGRLMDVIRAYTRMGRDWRIDPQEVVISTDLDLRNDGLPRSGQRKPQDPGVAVYFKLDGEAHCLPCDAYKSIEDNLAAVAQYLEAMRTLDRVPVGDLRTAFAGFRALPPGEGSGVAQPAMTVEAAAAWVREQSGLNLSASQLVKSAGGYRDAYRCAAKRLHPDVGGSEQDFKVLQDAKRVLDKHHGIGGGG